MAGRAAAIFVKVVLMLTFPLVDAFDSKVVAQRPALEPHKRSHGEASFVRIIYENSNDTIFVGPPLGPYENFISLACFNNGGKIPCLEKPVAHISVASYDELCCNVNFKSCWNHGLITTEKGQPGVDGEGEYNLNVTPANTIVSMTCMELVAGKCALNVTSHKCIES